MTSAHHPITGTGATEGLWKAAGHPQDGRPIYVLSSRLVKFTHYKPDGRRQMGTKGRWQEAGEYGGWSNCAKPEGPWILAGHTIPDALTLAMAAPDLRDALFRLVALWEDSEGKADGDVEGALTAARSALLRAQPVETGEGWS